MLPIDIASDDPEFLDLLHSLPKATFTIGEIVANGPARTTKVYSEIEAGRLVAAYCGARRFVTAPDYARWLLIMRRESSASDAAQERGDQASARQLAPHVQRRRQERRERRALTEAVS
jgi:hypothetical protein